MADELIEKTEQIKFKTTTKTREITTTNKISRYISAGVKAKVYTEHGGKCKNCGSNHALQIEHRKPFAIGGGNNADNLTLLCRSCNQRGAIRALGMQKMLQHLKCKSPTLCQ